MRLVLLRHGMTEANERREYCGSTDLPLSERGTAALTELKKTVSYPDRTGFTLITSGMRRTDETLRILYGCEPDRRESLFREIDFGRFERHTYEELKNDADYQAWIMDTTGDAVPTGGESANAFAERVLKGLGTLKEDTILICHGGVIARIMAHCFPDEGKNMYEWQGSFGRGWSLTLENGNNSYTQI